MECWKVYSQNKTKEHRSQFPSHVPRIISSKYFATEKKFIALAKALSKFRVEGDSEFYESPYS